MNEYGSPESDPGTSGVKDGGGCAGAEEDARRRVDEAGRYGRVKRGGVGDRIEDLRLGGQGAAERRARDAEVAGRFRRKLLVRGEAVERMREAVQQRRLSSEEEHERQPDGGEDRT